MIRQVAKPTCVICGSGGLVVYEGMSDDLYAAPGSWALTRCGNADCKLMWLDPAPHADDLGLLYRDYHTHSEVEDLRPSLRLARSLYRLIADCVLSVFGLPAEKRRARLMFIGGEDPATLMDIGCGDGSFLREMADRGWQVSGVDFDAEAVALSRARHHLEVRVGTVESLVANGLKYDVVTASHVIEHVPDPIEFLRKCGQLLRPGGRIILRTPNCESFGHRVYGRAWRGLEPPRHLQLFTLSAISACARKAGLKTASYCTTAADAEGILIVSHFLRRKGTFRLADLSKWDLLEWMMIAPILAARAKFAWLRDKRCGEEIYAVFVNDPT